MINANLNNELEDDEGPSKNDPVNDERINKVAHPGGQLTQWSDCHLVEVESGVEVEGLVEFGVAQVEGGQFLVDGVLQLGQVEVGAVVVVAVEVLDQAVHARIVLQFLEVPFYILAKCPARCQGNQCNQDPE